MRQLVYNKIGYLFIYRHRAERVGAESKRGAAGRGGSSGAAGTRSAKQRPPGNGARGGAEARPPERIVEGTQFPALLW